jgi:CheY-like chemotaxis protein
MNPFQPLRVLIVEDHPDTAVSLAYVLQALDGFDVSYATSPAQAIADALQETPDVIISDICLPGMDGCELAEELLHVAGEMKGNRPLMVAVSGLGEAVRERCLKAGFDFFFRKPAAPEALERLLRAYADMQQAIGVRAV